MLLLAGVGLGVSALFPAFFHGGQSLASDNSQLVFNLINFGGWGVAAVVVLTRRVVLGAWMAGGVTASTLGFYVLDTGYVARYGAHVAGIGFWLGQANWVICALGTGLALHVAQRRGISAGIVLGPVALPLAAAVAGIAAAVAYVPGWERLRVFAPGRGSAVSGTSPNAFHNPGAVIVGHLVVIFVLVVTPTLATLLRPGLFGAAALLGLIIPQAANVISGLVQVLSPVDPRAWGFTSQQASAAKAVLTLSATPWFWAEAVAVGLLVLVLLARLLTLTPDNG